jgi:hypothetical protein
VVDEVDHVLLSCEMSRMCNTLGANKIFVGKPQGKRPLKKPKHTWEDNIIMDLRETDCEDVK